MNHKNQNLTNETRTGLAQAKNLKYSLRDYYFLLILNILQLNLLLSTAIKDCISESMLLTLHDLKLNRLHVLPVM